MFIVLGANGHVGSSVASRLKDAGHGVIGVTHSEAGAEKLRAQGYEAETVDVRDVEALRMVFQKGKRAFLLNPPGDIRGDSDRAEEATAQSIALALKDSGLEKVVVESTYGAKDGEAIGDLTTLYHFEKNVEAQGIPMALNRGAYYYTNFDMLLPAAQEGKLPTMLPADLKVPMVSPADLGVFAAQRLLSGLDDVGLGFAEGPERLSMSDVAAVFGDVLRKAVTLDVSPRERWEADFKAQGFSAEAAYAYARMTAATVDDGFVDIANVHRGSTSLKAHLTQLLKAG